MPPAPLTPADSIAAIVAWLSQAAVTRGLLGLLSQALLNPIIDRLRTINQRIGRIAARVGAGRYKPRSIAAPRRPTPKPRRADPLPKTVGWLLPLVPGSAGARAQLETLFRDPAMAALMAAAPTSLARPLRALCRMLGAAPPPVLAPPVRPRKPRPARPSKPRPPPPPELPAWMRIGPQRKPWSMARIRGAPKRA